MYPLYGYFGVEEKCEQIPVTFPPQHQQQQPGIEHIMVPRPIYDNPGYVGSGKLKGKVAIITGGDSGIGRAVAVAYAKEGADVAIVYLYEREDAAETKAAVEAKGQRCLTIAGDLRQRKFCQDLVRQTVEHFGQLDILVNNAGVGFGQESLLNITPEQLETVFGVNIYAPFYVTQAALPHLKPGSSIINTASFVAYEGLPIGIDYAASKGALVAFTRSLAQSLVPKVIRVNAVAPGFVWTPLIVSSNRPEEVKHFGADVPVKRAAQPFEMAPAFVYLACDDSMYVTGTVLHVNGGMTTES